MSDIVRITVDLDAPICPGECAAGLRLGDRIESCAPGIGTAFQSERVTNPYVIVEDFYVLRSDDVIIHTKLGVITLISCGGEYRGAVRDCIRLGDTIASAANNFGSVGEDDEDNLVFANLPGLAVEIPATPFVGAQMESRSTEWVDCILACQITDVFVFATTCACGRDLRNRPDIARCPGCNTIVFDPIVR